MKNLLSYLVKLTGETNRCESDKRLFLNKEFCGDFPFFNFFNQSTKCKTQTQFQRCKALA